ncbi:MAG: aminoglycoside phosphotransferase family protein [Caldilineaceae bacterium SB0664_bin_22]|nr:aminoglycoside phosphotransferase family protein [Caldilineaceae bacterium SB0664_bin_22]
MPAQPDRHIACPSASPSTMASETGTIPDPLHWLAHAPASPVHGQAVRLTDTLTGDSNALWKVETGTESLVLKMFLDAGQARGRRQYNAQTLAWRADLAPEPLVFDRYPEGLARQVLVYRWCPGCPLDVRDPAHREALAQSLGQLHRLAPTPDTRLSPHPINAEYQWNLIEGSLRRLERWRLEQPWDELNAALTAAMQEGSRQLPALVTSLEGSAPAAVVHGELYGEHCLMYDGRVRMVDWELAGIGDPARECAHVILHMLRNLPADDCQAWQDRYLSEAGQANLAPRVELYVRLLPLEGLLNLALLLTRRQPTAEADAGRVGPLLRVAFRECMSDVNRALKLDFADEELDQFACQYQRRLQPDMPMVAGGE